MHLIVLLGLIAKVALVSSDCDGGTLRLNDFDWTKFTGTRPWYWLAFTPSGFEENLDCIATTYADPVGNRSVMTTVAYDTRDKLHVTFNGFATNWNITGFYEIYDTETPWTGRYYIIAIDYARYFISTYCSLQLNELFTAVAFRSAEPDEDTWTAVEKDLRDNDIDVSQMVVSSAVHLIIYFGFRPAHPDDATMEDVKNASSNNGIPFENFKPWNGDRCLREHM